MLFRSLGTVYCRDSSAGYNFAGVVVLATGKLEVRLPTSNTSNRMDTPTATVPFGAAWASGDYISISGCYEAA